MKQSVVREGDSLTREGRLLEVYSGDRDVYWEFIREVETFIGHLFTR